MRTSPDQTKSLIEDKWPDIHSEQWRHVLTLLRRTFNNNKDTRKIFFSYPWVMTDPKDKKNDIVSFGEKIGEISLKDCDIQADLKHMQRVLETLGFEVHMDLSGNDHGGDKLHDQIVKKIDTYDLLICFLTPVYKLKVADYPDKSYVLKEEYDCINERKKPTYRFIMVGDNESSVPKDWKAYLCTKQSHKTKVEQLKFILKKILVAPGVKLEEGEDLFDRIWKDLEQINLQQRSPSEPTSYGAIQLTLSSQPQPVVKVPPPRAGVVFNIKKVSGDATVGHRVTVNHAGNNAPINPIAAMDDHNKVDYNIDEVGENATIGYEVNIKK